MSILNKIFQNRITNFKEGRLVKKIIKIFSAAYSNFMKLCQLKLVLFPLSVERIKNKILGISIRVKIFVMYSDIKIFSVLCKSKKFPDKIVYYIINSNKNNF